MKKIQPALCIVAFLTLLLGCSLSPNKKIAIENNLDSSITEFIGSDSTHKQNEKIETNENGKNSSKEASMLFYFFTNIFIDRYFTQENSIDGFTSLMTKYGYKYTNIIHKEDNISEFFYISKTPSPSNGMVLAYQNKPHLAFRSSKKNICKNSKMEINVLEAKLLQMLENLNVNYSENSSKIIKNGILASFVKKNDRILTIFYKNQKNNCIVMYSCNINLIPFSECNKSAELEYQIDNYASN